MRQQQGQQKRKTLLTLLLAVAVAAGLAPVANGADGAASPPCYKSSLGYQCMLQVCPTVAVHWSVGGDPPSASCTYASTGNSGTGTAAVLATMDAQQLGALTVHWALVSTEHTGFVALSFPAVGGEMVPADAVAGFIPEGSTAPAVRPYYIQGFKESSNPVDPSVVVANASVVQQQQQLVACFSRALAAKGQAQVALNLDGMPMNFAAGAEHRLTDHETQCAVMVSLNATLDANASPAPVGGNMGTGFVSDEGELLAHGWLMVVAWALLVPLGVLVAQHKEQVNPFLSEKLGLKPNAPWFPVHVTTQALALVLFMVSLWVIISVNGLETDEWQGLMRAHGGIAITIFILCVLHLTLAMCRPKPDAQGRPIWVMAHRWTARIIWLLAFINLMTGPKLLVRSIGEAGASAGMYVVTFLLLACIAGLAVVLGLRKRATHAGRTSANDASYAQMISLGPSSARV